MTTNTDLNGRTYRVDLDGSPFLYCDDRPGVDDLIEHAVASGKFRFVEVYTVEGVEIHEIERRVSVRHERAA